MLGAGPAPYYRSLARLPVYDPAAAKNSAYGRPQRLTTEVRDTRSNSDPAPSAVPAFSPSADRVPPSAEVERIQRNEITTFGAGVTPSSTDRILCVTGGESLEGVYVA